MEQQRTKIIKLSATMGDPKGILIPRGVQEKLVVEIADEAGVFYFKDKRTTKKFAIIEIEGDKAKGKEPTMAYLERIGKAIKKYPGKTKEEIRDIILDQLKSLKANVKVK